MPPHFRQQMTRLLDRLDYDFRAFTLDSFIAWVEKQIERHILIVERPLPPHVNGLWISDAEDPYEYLFIADDLPALQRTHTILHEVIHIILNHNTLKVTEAQLRSLLPMLQDDSVGLEKLWGTVLLRAYRPNREEQEAEIMAHLIQERLYAHERLSALTAPSTRPHTRAYLQKLGLGHDA